MTEKPPGWYDRQSTSAPLRWFDGSSWTDYTRVDHVPYERRHVFMKADVGPAWLRLSTVLAWLLAGCGLLVLAFLAYYIWLVGLIGEWEIQPPSDADVDRLIEREELLGLARLVCVLGTGVVFAVWLYLAHRSDRLAADRRRHRSFWAWLGWIIPFAQLFMPPRMVNDVRRASQPESSPPADRILGAWWACLLLGGIIGRVASGKEVGDLDDFHSTMRWAIVSDLLILAAAVLAVLLVREIRQRVRTSPYGPHKNPLPETAGQPLSES